VLLRVRLEAEETFRMNRSLNHQNGKKTERVEVRIGGARIGRS
jgi:hypothetical protein